MALTAHRRASEQGGAFAPMARGRATHWPEADARGRGRRRRPSPGPDRRRAGVPCWSPLATGSALARRGTGARLARSCSRCGPPRSSARGEGHGAAAGERDPARAYRSRTHGGARGPAAGRGPPHPAAPSRSRCTAPGRGAVDRPCARACPCASAAPYRWESAGTRARAWPRSCGTWSRGAWTT
ncbi:hypothetical protein QJS66_07830 [Kocuria rhizophila]|nr:hypothetical protein QJS66_07830 [Kocuria rhizophila]